ncbi:arginyl-tRNA synthetase (argS) [Methanocaldococcus jannaschii DSM 2661]|uniref:Arginine--tRNA ligase n=1 Tax=Methanocaldococcus jannaschii (strain ATCC 43067 / DSM 2661 / JAL-1 / JCM 10045 / NBRC 100440) TaxID=243232 RepID=SYR_METJA|nr:arginine--tRNA ligase [Methanocaldococcus jannaschii]Q57689.1 RecName: Full=Arginine--tRNA ligase; AltName: Full=Arginyl-tRNA synthetase; Short=ArgRS [Methanocaldococcus jannaschii DSM 2661]AAB98223.1 arginyl-tRNA synthetase (argS) [Methanocaldococcus jannaschii DSM 2661]
MDIKSNIINALKEVISKEICKEIDIKLDKTPNLELGDYSVNICFRLAKELKKNPKIIAEELVDKLKAMNIEGVKEIKAVNGYINFYIDYNKFAKNLMEEIDKKGNNYGRGDKKSIKIILEHTSANPNGPLHIGHLRNAIIGDCLKRILEFYGYDVETHYYVNDMGRQMALVVYGIELFGLDKEKKKDHAIAETYVKINKYLEEHPEEEEKILELMRKYEDALENNEDNEITKKFEFAVNYALDGIKETLKNLNIKHDTFVWESSYVRNGMVKKVIEKLMETGKVIKEETYMLDLSDFGIEKKMVLARANGTSLYSTRDIAYHLDKLSKCDIGIDVLGADHKLTAEMVKAALKLLGSKVPEVIFYEFISLPEGSMSTRRGRFISTDELLEEAIKRAKEECNKRGVEENIAYDIGLGAVRYNIARISPEKPMVFRWEEALDFEKVGCPFIQYAHARCCSILKEAENKGVKDEAVFNYELTSEEKELIKMLDEFKDIIKESAESRRVHILANYLLELAKAFNRFYANCPILMTKVDDDVKKSRLKLVKSTKTVLETGLELLGINCPGRM